MTGPWAVGAIVLAGMLSACTSPEATRMRAEGRGGDVGNVGEVVQMHEGSAPYWRTPRLDGIGGPPLDPAQQADRLGR
jgi:hypothetical protein